jgi:UDP-glucose 4-epimerase
MPPIFESERRIMGGLKVAVTGAAGFIGSNLCRRLLATDDVLGIDKLDFGTSSSVGVASPPPFKFQQIDLSDPTGLNAALSGRDLVYHLAANADVTKGSEDTSIDLRDNLLATHSLLEAMRKEDVREIVFTSTSLVYANATQRPTPEHYGPLWPISHYAASKLAAEAFISSYSATYGLKKTIFRFANVIGRDQRRMVTYDFVTKLKSDPSSLTIRGNGKQRRSFLYIDDCIDGMIQLRGKADGLFNLATKTTTSVDEVANIVSQELGIQPKIRYDRKHGDIGFVGDLMEIELDPSKALSEGWRYRFESPDAVRVAARDFIAQVKSDSNATTDRLS